MTDKPTPLEQEIAEANWRIGGFIEFFLFALEQAARRDPDRVKKALQNVFTPAAVAHTYRRAEKEAAEAKEKVEALEARLKAALEQTDELERRLDLYELKRTEVPSGRGNKPPASRAG